jgi:glutamate synthase (NADPH/NADH) small chain
MLELEYTAQKNGKLEPTGETLRVAADQIFTAIGQTLETSGSLVLEGRKIAVNGVGRTSRDGVWAGGDCASSGDDLTVTAVAEGRDAAMDIHTTFMGGA